jgi:hypothetical protein
MSAVPPLKRNDILLKLSEKDLGLHSPVAGAQRKVDL